MFEPGLCCRILMMSTVVVTAACGGETREPTIVDPLRDGGTTAPNVDASVVDAPDASVDAGMIVDGVAPANPNPPDAFVFTSIQTGSQQLWWAHPGSATYDVYFGTTETPTEVVASGLTRTSHTVRDLAPNTRYYWFAVARSEAGIHQSETWSFTTSATFLTVPCPDDPSIEIDGRRYGTALVGDRCWTTENLVAGLARDGTVYDDGQLEHFCSTDDASICGLYPWRELGGYDDGGAGYRVCPPGWRIPSRNDWQAMIDAYANDVDDLVNGRMGFRLERDNRYQPRENGATCTLPGSQPPVRVDCTRARLQETRGNNAVGWYWASNSTRSQHVSVELFFEDRAFHLELGSTPVEFGLSVRCVR